MMVYLSGLFCMVDKTKIEKDIKKNDTIDIDSHI